MIIKQLSIFLENKMGRLMEVSQLLCDAKVNMSAFSVADTSEFGILRVIVSDPEKALAVLKENNFSVNLTDVVCFNAPNESGALARVLKILNANDVAIEYLYAFSGGDTAKVILKPGDINHCIQTLQEHKVELIKANDLYKI